MAIGQYKRRISEITEEIKECANSVTSEAETITQQMDLQDLLVELLKRYMNKQIISLSIYKKENSYYI